MESSTITVIIPAYNVARYITEALDSLSCQRSLPDEVIIINDGSTDATLDIIEAYHHRYPVSVLSTVNQGQGPARNMGVSLAHGEYIYFFDSDDMLEPDFIGDMREIITDNARPDIIFFSGKCLYETTWVNEQDLGYSRGILGAFSSPVALLDAFTTQGVISPSPCLYVSKRLIWLESDLRFIDYYHEDEHILFPLIFSADSYFVTDAVYFIRRVRASSTMTQRKTERHVMGLRATVLSLLDMRASVADRDIGKYVTARGLLFLKRYICLCRRSGVACDRKVLLSAFFILKSPKVPLYSLYYSSGARLRGAVKRLLGSSVSAEVSR